MPIHLVKYWQCSPKSASVYAQFDQCLYYLPADSLDTVEYISKLRKPLPLPQQAYDIYTLVLLILDIPVFASSVDQDQLASSEAN